jgi:fibro-slime domain-containing protein
MRSTLFSRVCLAIGTIWLAACAGVKPNAAGGTGGTTSGPGGAGLAFGTGGHGTGGSGVIGDGGSTGGTSVSQSTCGDGFRAPDEACDDGNATDGDGCSADCRTVDPAYVCVPEGKPCHRIARCGDGITVIPELCDDGNMTAGDGCSPTCKLEPGWKCSGSPSKCSHTTCGDKVVEGTESCDDGNALPFDGCAANCQNEPQCKTGSSCTSRCGDGLVVNEACDDGNNVSGDGCSADCKIEPGYTCKQPDLGDKLSVPAVYRDFRAKNPAEFEPGATGRNMALTGMVKPDLDADGKPVYTGAVTGSFVTSAATFAEWYRDTAGVNHTTAGKLTLWSNGKGAYVNRYGANGEQWPVTVQAYYCGNVGSEKLDPVTGLPIPCTSLTATGTDCDKNDALGYKQLTCTVTNGSYVATYQSALLDGTPLFFPVDGDTFTPTSERVAAQIGPPYSGAPDKMLWIDEPGKPKHNFSFTSEVRYWFQYDAKKTYTLDFTGDDDVWVFINRKLAVDLGGIHTAAQGSVTFGAGMPAKFGLTDGQVYEVAVFQAERQTYGSSYRLTLSGFNAAPSDCKPICGDGILGLGEECDDGKNVGGYGNCAPGCKLGEYCGDGIVQMDHEDCDDGVNIGKPCPSGCKRLFIP